MFVYLITKHILQRTYFHSIHNQHFFFFSKYYNYLTFLHPKFTFAVIFVVALMTNLKNKKTKTKPKKEGSIVISSLSDHNPTLLEQRHPLAATCPGQKVGPHLITCFFLSVQPFDMSQPSLDTFFLYQVRLMSFWDPQAHLCPKLPRVEKIVAVGSNVPFLIRKQKRQLYHVASRQSPISQFTFFFKEKKILQRFSLKMVPNEWVPLSASTTPSYYGDDVPLHWPT